MVRTALFEVAQSMLTRTVPFSTLKHWAPEVSRRRGMRRAKVSLARKLATAFCQSSRQRRIWWPPGG